MIDDFFCTTGSKLAIMNLWIYLHCFPQVLSSDNTKYGYNAATGNYEDLMAAGIIDPTKVRYLGIKLCFILKQIFLFGIQTGFS